MILNNTYIETKSNTIHDLFKIIVQKRLCGYKIRLWTNTKNFIFAIVNNGIIFLVMYIIIGSHYFISIILKHLKIGSWKLQCTSKLCYQFLSILYFISLINLYI